MPPIVLTPQNNGTTTGASYNFNPVNAHGLHPATSVNQWRVTVTTAQSNGGTLKCDTGLQNAPIATIQITNLPADNGFYWTQIVYSNNNGTYISTSNKFQSLR